MSDYRPNATEVAKIVKGSSRDAKLHVSQAEDGRLWATNSFWLVPAERVSAYLVKWNLDPMAAGSYDVNGRCSNTGREAPRIDSLFPAVADLYGLAPVELDGRPVYHRAGDLFVALYEEANVKVCEAGPVQAVNVVYRDFLEATDGRSGKVSWWQAKPGGPLVARLGADLETVGLVMPVRL